ncbi:MAG: XdhC family protein [Anaerolineales bacterium]|nr:XdhC family protein [Anaerolineales bacterium]
MEEVRTDINKWRAGNDKEPIALATVIQTWGSAPRKAGAKMALTPDGKLSGSVSGGCVEGAVFEEGREALAKQRAKLLSFGVADETAWEVGLACGGNIQVFVEPLALNEAVYTAVDKLMAAERAAATATVIGGDESLLGRKLLVTGEGERVGGVNTAVDNALAPLLQKAIQQGQSQRFSLPDLAANDLDIFVDVYLPPPQLIMVGGVHIAIALTALAKTLGYRTIVVDPRKAFGSEARFEHVDELVQLWPKKAFAGLTVNENTAVALLTHDPKIDDPALHAVLTSPAFYIGALGSNRTHAKRVARLAEAGFTLEQINRIHGPIGLDINAQNPEEIALSVLAEIVQVRRSA